MTGAAGPQKVYRDGRVHVMAERCATCILRPDGSIRERLEPGRVKQLVEENRAAGAALACHHTTYGQGARGEAVCKGYFDLFADETRLLRLAVELDVITWQASA